MQGEPLDREDDAGEEEELDLRTLPDDELVAQMHDDLYDGLKEEIEEGTNILLERGWEAKRVLDDALVEGMRGGESISGTAFSSSPRCFSPPTR